MHTQPPIRYRQRIWSKSWPAPGLITGAVTAVLFAAAHHTWGLSVLFAGIIGALGAWGSHYAIAGLIGKRLAVALTLWLMLAVVVLALAPMMIVQFYAAVGVVGIWTMCIAFQDVLR